jgi:Caspase domain
MSILRFIAAAWLALICAVLPAHAEKRVALVVGNSAYRNAEVLDNPVNDARGMRDALNQIGFDVTYGENLDQRTMRQTIGQFARAVRGADVAVVYFAGHGATFGDTPYVAPVDAEFTSLEQVPYELVPVELLIGELRRVNGVRIAILDACRGNAAERELKRLSGAGGGDMTRGLAPLKNPQGLILAYATQYMSTAPDSAGSANSPFTTALLHNIATPGLDVKDLFFRVVQEVVIATDSRQRPEISISMNEPYALVPAAEPADTPPPAVAPMAVAVPAKPAETPLQAAIPAPVDTPPEGPPAKPAEAPPQPAGPSPVVTAPAGLPVVMPAKPAEAPQQAAIPAPVDTPPEGPPLGAPSKPGRRIQHAARPPERDYHERDHHERRRARRESDWPERPSREVHAPPVINDCIRVTFPQCNGRGGR